MAANLFLEERNGGCNELNATEGGLLVLMYLTIPTDAKTRSLEKVHTQNTTTKILGNTLEKRNWTGNCGGAYNELQPAGDKPPASLKHAGSSCVPRSLPTFLPEYCNFPFVRKGTLKSLVI